MRVLVFGAHPDDMEVGMGGTIAKHSDLGDEVLMVVATVSSQGEVRAKEAARGAEILGARLQMLNIPADEFEYDRGTVRRVDQILTDFDPTVIYTQWDQDSHQDHNTISKCVISAARKNRCSLLMYEQTIPGGIVPGGFRDQCFVDISDYIDRKLESIYAHASQLELHGERWPKGVRGRASYRGFQINRAYAEAFEVIKEIDVHFHRR